MSISGRASRWTLSAFAALSIYITEAQSHAGTLAQFRTTVGDIEVELFDEDKPITVSNFKRYVESGSYLDTIFHRATIPPQVLVIQGGGIAVGNRSSLTNFFLYYISTFPSIVDEIGVGTFRSNTYGTIAMAKTSSPNSATSQFFFNLADNSAALDDTNNSGGFTVFGHVVGGTNVLNKLNAASATTEIQRAYLSPSLAEVPLLKTAEPPLESDEFVYVDITLLSVQIALTNNLRQISWNSVSGLPNVVEYTTTMPPAWNTLVSTNGTGSRMAVIDPTATNQYRFYRVRVNY